MQNFVKKTLCIMLILMIVVAFSACGTSGDQSGSGDGNNADSGNPVSTGETEAEGRSAIIFKTICSGDGVVVVSRNGETLETYDGMRLAVGDSIICGSDCECCIRIDDDKNILLDTDTIMSVEALDNGMIKLKMSVGQFFCEVKNKLDDDESMEFDVGGVSLAIRGTSLSATYEGVKEFTESLLKELLNLADSSFVFDPTEYMGENIVQIYDGTVHLIDSQGVQEMVTSGQAQPLLNLENGNLIIETDPIISEPIEIMYDYVAQNNDYQETLVDVGWTVEPNDIYISQDKVDENIEEAMEAFEEAYNNVAEANLKLEQNPDNQNKDDSDNPGSSEDENKSGDEDTGEEKDKDTARDADSKLNDSEQKDKSTEEKTDAKKVVKGACGKHSGNEGEFDLAAHAKLDCGHYACESGSHKLLACGEHYACQVKDASTHSKCAYCGEGLCNGKDHSTVLVCGHHACEVTDSASHAKCSYCVEYLCNGKDHSTVLACGHHACESGSHSLGVCGYHYACQAGYTASAHSDGACGYLNGKPYTPPTEEVQNITLACGHTVAAGSEAGHEKMACGHFACKVGTDTDLHTATCTGCGGYLCDGGNHTACEHCGDYYCAGCADALVQVDDETWYCYDCIASSDRYKICQACGTPIDLYPQDIETGGTQYTSITYASCSNCTRYYCGDCRDLNIMTCAHNDAGAGASSCTNSICTGCGTKCSVCDKLLCIDHIEECSICGEYVCDSCFDNHTLPCGHSCKDLPAGTDLSDHALMSCGHYACRAEKGEEHSTVLSCGHYACQVDANDESHNTRLACGHYACTPGDHELGPCQYHYKCDTGYDDISHTDGACGYLNGEPYIP